MHGFVAQIYLVIASGFCEAIVIQGFADKMALLLTDNELRTKFGTNGISHIKNNFLVTRLLLDYLNIFEQYLLPKK